MNFTRFLVATALVCGLGAMPALAQETVLGGAGDNAAPAATAAAPAAPTVAWATRCVSDSRTAPVDCSLVQRLVTPQGEQVGGATIRMDATGKPNVLANLPLGLAIPAGVTMDVDGAQSQPLQLQTCDRNGCYAAAPIPDAVLAAMQKGKKFNVNFQTLNKRAVSLPLSLAGFTAAYAKIK
jgi:invasion protein IalB